MTRRDNWMGILLVLILATPKPNAEAQPTQLTGELVATVAETFQREAEVNFQLILDDRSTVRLSMSVDLLRPFGGLRAMDQRRVMVQGSMLPEIRDRVSGAVTLVFAVAGIRPLAPQAAHAAAAQRAGPISGTFKWIVIGCRFGGSTFTPIPSSMWPTFLGSTAPGLDHYWQEVSGGKVNLTGSTSTDWLDLPQPNSYYTPGFRYDADRLRADCVNAADAAVNFTQYDGIIMQFSDYLYAGSSNSFASFAYFNPQQLMLDGQMKGYRLMFISYGHHRSLHVWAHEMGHTFGFPHSSGAQVMARFPYDSYWDVMSDGSINNSSINGTVPIHTIAYHKWLAGWVTPEQTFVATSGARTVRLERSAQPQSTTNFRYIRIDVPGDPGAFYTVEARQAAGYDAAGFPRGLPGDGVVIHKVDPDGDLFNVNLPRATVVDGDLFNNSVNDAGAIWMPGETFADPYSGISVAVAAVPGVPTAYDVTVNVGPSAIPTLTPNVPAPTLSGGAQSDVYYRLTIPPGTAVLAVGLSGGSGDADLYVRQGRLPSELANNCASEAIGNTEACVIANPTPGDWYVLLHGWAAYNNTSLQAAAGDLRMQVATAPSAAVSGQVFSPGLAVQLIDGAGLPLQFGGLRVTARMANGSGSLFGGRAATSQLVGEPDERKVERPHDPVEATTLATGMATFTGTGISGVGPHAIAFSTTGLPTATSSTISVAQAPLVDLTLGATLSGLSGTTGTTTAYRILVPAGTAGVLVGISGGTGDADLYVRRAGVPTTDLYDCRPFSFSSNETCRLGTATSGEIYVLLRSFSSFSGLSLTASGLTQRFALATEPGGATSGVPLVQQPVVRLLLGDNTPIAVAGVTITAARVTGSGSLSGTLTALTDATGAAAFTNLVVSGSGDFVLQFSATNYGTATSQPVAVTAQTFVLVRGTGAGSGTVSGGSISCPYTPGATPASTCLGGFPATATVLLTGTASTGSMFLGWSGATCIGGAPCTLSMNATRIIKAYFVEAAPTVTNAIDELLGTPKFTSAETLLLDDQGNRNGSFDLGDLLALLDRNNATVSLAILEAIARLTSTQPDTVQPRRIKR